jgi:CDGSH-type Zn-finger protein
VESRDSCLGPEMGLLPDGKPRRMRLMPDGPMLVDGPVEITLPDGQVCSSDRFVVAICMCRRSKRFPWCDTSHRKRKRVSGSAADQPGHPD